MANRYWVGGTGTWNTTSTTNWSASSGGTSGASVPTAADSVFFDQATTYTVTMTGALVCLDITVSSGTVTFATGATPTLAVSGSMSLIAGTVWNSTGAITFNATTTGKTITTNGITINGAITFNGAGGGWSLGSALTTGATLTTTLTAGTLTLNNFTLTTGIFSSSNTNTRSIAFGSGNIVLVTNSAAQTVLSMTTATGFTWTGTGGFTADASTTRTYVFGTTGGASTNAPNLTLTGSGTSVGTFTSNSWFNKLDFGSTAFTVAATTLNLNGLTLSSQAAATYTALTVNAVGTGTITSNGKQIAAMAINSTTGTTTLGGAFSVVSNATVTLTSGTLALNGFNLTAGVFSSSGSSTRAISFGAGNIILNHTTAGTTVLNMAIATGFTWTGTGAFQADASTTRTYTFGTTGGTATNAPNLTLVTGTTNASVGTFTTGSWFNTLNFGPSAFTIAATSLNLNGLTLSSQAAATYTALTATMVGTGTITPNGKSIAAFTINNGAGTTTLAGALGVTTYTQTAGTINFASFNLTCSSTAVFTAGTLNNIGTISCTTWTTQGTFAHSSGTITPSTSFVTTSGSYVQSGTSVLSSVATFTQTAGNVTFRSTYALTATGTYTLTAGTLTLGGNLTTGVFSSSGALTRAISFGSNNIVLSHTSAATTVLSMAIATGFTWTGTGGFTADASITRTYTFGTTGGSATNSPNLSLTGSGSAIPTFTTGSLFNALNFGTTTFNPGAVTINVNSLTLSSTGTYNSLTVNVLGPTTNSIVTNNKALNVLNIIPSTVLANTLLDTSTTNSVFHAVGTLNLLGTLTSTNLYTTGVTTRNIIGSDVIVTGNNESWIANAAGSFFIPTQTANNIYIFSAPVPALSDFTVESFYYLTANTAATNYAPFSFGGGGGSFRCFVQPAAGLIQMWNGTSTRLSVTITPAARLANTWNHLAFTMNALQGTLWFNGQNVASYKENVTLNGGILTIGSDSTGAAAGWIGYLSNFRYVLNNAVYTGNFTVPRNILTVTQSASTNIGAIAAGQTQVLLTTTDPLNYLTDSNTTPKGVTNVSGVTFSANNPGLLPTGTSSSNLTVSSTIKMTGTGAKIFSGGNGSNYGTITQGGAGPLTITGNNIFYDINTTIPNTGANVIFQSYTTQTFSNFNLSGVYISSTIPGTAATLFKSSGIVSVTNLSIRDSTATGGATWYAGTSSFNISNNTGWIFTAVPTVSYSNFFAFF